MNKSKQKGNAFEYDVQYSLSNIYPGITRTAERGYQRQFDLISEKYKVAIECKRMTLTWNKIIKTFDKLAGVTPREYFPILIIKPNNTEPLVMQSRGILIAWSNHFDSNDCPFQKHPSTRPKRVKNDEESLKKRGTCEHCKNRRLLDYRGLCFDCWCRSTLTTKTVNGSG